MSMMTMKVMSMNRGKNGRAQESFVVEDPTAWLIHGTFTDVLLMNTYSIKCMVILAYAFLHGCKLYPSLPPSASRAHKFVSLILQCTGGGILVPIFINSIPVPLSMDIYPIAILVSFILHEHVPILREVVQLSPPLKGTLIILYEIMRAFVVTKFTAAAAQTIAASDFAVPVFGPIFCGTIAGCGGAFLPLHKGLDPLLAGLAQPMRTALVGAAFYHWFTTNFDILEPHKKAQVLVTCFFILHNLYTTFIAEALHRRLLRLRPQSRTEPTSSLATAAATAITAAAPVAQKLDGELKKSM